MNEHIRELMHQHADGLLNKAGQRELQEALRDPQCREYFDKMKKANEIIQKGLAASNKPKKQQREGLPSMEEIENNIRKYGGKMDDNFRQKMEKLHIRYEWRQRKRKTVIRWSSAAAVLMIGMIGLWTGLNPGAKRLYEKYYSPHDFYNYRSERSVPLEYSQSTGYYNKGNYEVSALFSGKMMEQEPGNANYRFLYALSLQGKGEIKAAIIQYKILIEDNGARDEKIYPLSAWYLGLCYLLEGNNNSADHYLEIAGKAGGMWVDRRRVEELRSRL